jgi:histidine triad (HIT) family protein
MTDNCIFCLIAQHQAPAAIVYEDAETMAFMDANPIVEGHTLVIPKNHARNLFALSETDGVAVMRTLTRVARSVKIALNVEGMNVFQANERAAGQSVFHFHFHVLPRFSDDGLMTRQSGQVDIHWRALGHKTVEQLEETARKIRAQSDNPAS